MGIGIIALVGTVASSFFIFCLTRGMKMRDEGRRLAGWLWLLSGLLPLAAICLLWASMGDQFVWPQRVILFSTGALIGGFGLLAFGEWIRPTTPPEPPPPSSSGPASNQMGAVNNQGIVTQGQVGNNIIIRPASPSFSGTLTPKTTLLFSPNKGEASSIAKLQFGTSNVIYGVKEIGRESPYLSLLFPALSERQFKIESVDGKIKISTQITDENGKLIAEIIRDEWKVAPPPSTWDRNYTDDALEVRDAFGNVVLQVKVLPDRIQLQGVWWIDLGPPNGAVRLFIRGNPKDGAQVVIVPKQNKSPPPAIEPMFRYPSDQNLGVLATRS